MNGSGRNLNWKRLGWARTLRRRICVIRGRWPVSMPCLPTGLIAGLAAALRLDVVGAEPGAAEGLRGELSPAVFCRANCRRPGKRGVPGAA